MGQCASVPAGARREEVAAVVRRAQTGDIVLMSGDQFVSRIIEFMTPVSKNWSHVALVVRDPRYPADDPDHVYLAESDLDPNGFDIMTQAPKGGPQVTSLRHRLDNYRGNFLITRRCTIRAAPGKTEANIKADMTARFASFFRQHGQSAKYDLNLWRLLASSGRLNRNPSPDYICTQFVADAFQHMGLVDTVRQNENYTLFDFTQGGQLYLLPGITYGEHIYVQTNKT